MTVLTRQRPYQRPATSNQRPETAVLTRRPYQRPATSDQQPDGPRHANGRKVRADALPEYLEYRDGGCDLSPTCLRCPLERCRYDEPGGARRLLQAPRDDALCRRRAEGVAIDALAAEFGLSRRTVFRVLAAGRVGAVARA
jgi:hypothetical protein